ncbi:unnamed protein product [Miscanthus lutarioriparius]|uniref:FH2 domain-containing protein n=1 Tax=Miscanthus lutarioriparius TaxID=422564 RepID=A0A811REW7_9POAL|nr:unnamed protein product [Miscanthus lutarioriparius]
MTVVSELEQPLSQEILDWESPADIMILDTTIDADIYMLKRMSPRREKSPPHPPPMVEPDSKEWVIALRDEMPEKIGSDPGNTGKDRPGRRHGTVMPPSPRRAYGSNMIVLTVAQSELKKPFKMKSDSQECRRAEVEAPTVSSAAAEAVEAGPCSEKSWPCTRTRPSATAGRPQAGPALAPSPVPTRPGAIAGGPETGSVDDLRTNLTTINDATKEVKESLKLRQIMQTILTLGNALNQGTARGILGRCFYASPPGSSTNLKHKVKSEFE